MPKHVVVLALFAALIAIVPTAPAAAPGGSFDLSDAVELERADVDTLAALQRVDRLMDQRQWPAAIDVLTRAQESAGDALVSIEPGRWINLNEYCQRQFARLPPEGLTLYRARVDDAARRWFDEGTNPPRWQPLARVVESAVASGSGDRALWALGELALEQADYAMARDCWRRLLPASSDSDRAHAPDSRYRPAEVQARLVWASILEGDLARARDELASFAKTHAGASGWLAGREGKLAETLASLLAAAQVTASLPVLPDWPTFAGNPGRNAQAAARIDVADVAWRLPLEGVRLPAAAAGMPAAQPIYPAVAEGRVYVATPTTVYAVDLPTGKPAWGSTAAIYREPIEVVAASVLMPGDTLGAPAWTVTVFDDRLFARLGAPVTARPQDATVTLPPSSLVCLDLRSEGRLLWRLVAEEGWAWQGTPVVDRDGLYVAMRRNDILGQAYVACFDLDTGRMRWRRFVCAAETPARGATHEATHHLLALDHHTLYYSTGLGVVAALATDTGRIRWLTCYPRARQGNVRRLAAHWRRTLSPCLVAHGNVFVAPADAPGLLALEAVTGRLLWQTGDGPADAVDLLAADRRHLIAAGQRLYWIGLGGPQAGRVVRAWPDGRSPVGDARGVVADRTICFPGRDRVFRFDLDTAEPRGVIELSPRGLAGGNLLAAGDYLLVASASELAALGPSRRPVESNRLGASQPIDSSSKAR